MRIWCLLRLKHNGDVCTVDVEHQALEKSLVPEASPGS